MKQHRDEERFVEQAMYCLTAPTIGWPGWEELLRQHREDITLQRLAHQREVFQTQQCTEFEAMLYLSTASLVAPVGHDWVQIYGYLFWRWNPEQGKEIWGQAPQLDPNQQEHLVRLRRWIYRQQLLHVKGKAGKARQEELEREQRAVEQLQPRLF